ncbi:MAG: FkbM family methyltransferase [Terriglobia bacterium]
MAICFSFPCPGNDSARHRRNQGLYTIPVAQRVGPQGKVIAFEPAPGEFRKLRWNVRINRCRNVVLEPVALSSQDGSADMFVCLDGFGSLSSLRHPTSDVKGRIKLTRVAVTTLDTYVRERNVEAVDFMKIDAEGGELEILKGGANVLGRLHPIIMCEMADVRTAQWGYGARGIYDFLQARGYEWFSPDARGLLGPAALKKRYDVWENLIAVPTAKVSQVQRMGEEAYSGKAMGAVARS